MGEHKFDSVHKTRLKSVLPHAAPLPLVFLLARHSFCMSQKISAECPVPSVTFDEGAYSSRVIEYRQILFITGLIWGLYGAQYIRFRG